MHTVNYIAVFYQHNNLPTIPTDPVVHLFLLPKELMQFELQC